MAAWAKCCSTQAWNAVPRRAATAGGARHRAAQLEREGLAVAGEGHDLGGGQVPWHDHLDVAATAAGPPLAQQQLDLAVPGRSTASVRELVAGQAPRRVPGTSPCAV